MRSHMTTRTGSVPAVSRGCSLDEALRPPKAGAKRLRRQTCRRADVTRPRLPEEAWPRSAAAEKYDMGPSDGEGESEAAWEELTARQRSALKTRGWGLMTERGTVRAKRVVFFLWFFFFCLFVSDTAAGRLGGSLAAEHNGLPLQTGAPAFMRVRANTFYFRSRSTVRYEPLAGVPEWERCKHGCGVESHA